LGDVPLTDSAPLLVAYEYGLFARRGLKVTLCRELGWATVRDKLVHGELDAAHAPCGLPFALTLGLGCVPTECISPLVLSRHGNAITLSKELLHEGIEDGLALAQFVRNRRSQRILVFGVVSLTSTQAWLLRSWLARAGLDPEREVRIVVVPPAQMSANLVAGNLDGFCAEEPWNSVAAERGGGGCVAASCELAPGHPEKVLAIRTQTWQLQPERVVELTAALLEAAMICADPVHLEELIQLLARREYLGLPPEQIRRAWTGDLLRKTGKTAHWPDFLVFHRGNSNDPSAEQAAWVIQQILDAPSPGQQLKLGHVFRSDLFAQARERLLAVTRLGSPDLA
jgi:ABC-type nitrate/sulfonate/bicarbonate transport system substrate-binding protein